MTKRNEFVTVMSFNTEMDAQVQKAFLASQGIASIIVKDDVGGMQPNFQLTGGVGLAVSERDEKKARQFLRSVKK